MTATRGVSFLDAFLSAWDEADESARRELGARLRPYLGEDPGRLLDVSEKAEQLGLHPDTLGRMARDERIWARKAGREWRFRADRSDIAPPAGAAVTPAVPMAPRRSRAVRASVAAIRGPGLRSRP